jgi:branched-chain amino acid transport system permease protein
MSMYRVETGTRAGRRFAWLGSVAILALVMFGFRAGPGPLATMTELFVLVALGQLWNLLAGYAGIYSFGQQAFVGIGAYTTFALADLVGWNLWASLAASALVAVVIALPTAWFVFRLRGGYFAVGTWVVAEAYRLVVKNNNTLNPRGTPQPLRSLAELGADRFTVVYLAALTIAVASILGVYLVRRSRIGLALSAIRDDIGAARASGVRVFRTQVIVYLLVAAFTGLAGSVYLLENVSIDPDSYFSIALTAEMVIVVVVGGLGTIEGPIIGAVVFFVLRENLSDLGTWWFIILGVALIVVMLRAPSGIWGVVRDRTGLRLFPVQRRLIVEDAVPATDETTTIGRSP